MSSGPHGARTVVGGTAFGQRSPFWVYAVFVLAPALLIAVLAYQPYVPFEHLTRDPLIVAGECARFQADLAAAGKCGSIYFGAVSNLGVLIWCAAAVVCIFAASQLYRRRQDMKAVWFMAYAGFFTAFLMFDDLFQGHELVFPKLIGLSDFATYGLYGIIALFYFALFWKKILEHDVLLLGIGLLGLAASVGADLGEMVSVRDEGGVGQHMRSLTHWVAEDGSKFVGASAWAGFHVRAAWQILTGYGEGGGAITRIPPIE